MASKRVSKASKRRLIIFGTVSFIVIGYFFFSLVTYGVHLGELNNEQSQLENKLTTLRSNENNLKIEIQKLKDPDYVARYARENYLYSKDGEYIIKIEPEKEKIDNDQSRLEVIDNKIIILISAVAIIAIAYFIKKKTTKK